MFQASPYACQPPYAARSELTVRLHGGGAAAAGHEMLVALRFAQGVVASSACALV